MESIIQTLTYGILVGALYGLVALGLGLIMGIMKFLNIAHGSFIILGGYLCFWLFTILHVDPYISVPMVIIVMFMFGLIFYKLTLSPLLKLPHIEMRIDSSMLITFGVLYVLDNAMALLWTANARSIFTTYTGESLAVFGINLSITGLLGLLTAVLIAIILYFTLSRTFFGKFIRAATQDADAARLCGINVNRTYLISCGISVALASVAGVAVVSIYSITPTGGLSWLLLAMVVMVLAGEGNLNVIIPAGIILGVVEAIATLVIGTPYRQAVALIVFILVLMFRTQGLFTKRGY